MSELIVWKLYWDYENEERWLNQMAAEGWDMIRYSWCRYVFEKGAPGRYVYRLQFLPKTASAPESREYLRFLEETGVEVVDTYMSWVYVRKAADGQPFELFTDRESQIAHHKRVATFFGAIAASQIPLLSVSMRNVTDQVRTHAYFSLPLLLVEFALVGVMCSIALRQLANVRRLEREAAVYE